MEVANRFSDINRSLFLLPFERADLSQLRPAIL